MTNITPAADEVSDWPVAVIVALHPTDARGLVFVEVTCPYSCTRGSHVRPWRLGSEPRTWHCPGHDRFRIAAA